ncbi:MAG: nucleotide sugar dehydrogenase [Propionibacteriaceae bacterium]|nr:nucleotide sugar dehydrogenase [Propionibacteriaceae bacterium]
MKIAVIGAGYVGFANAVVLSRHHEVVLVDIDTERVSRVQHGRPALDEPGMAEFMANNQLNLKATTKLPEAVTGATWTIIATPTNFNTESRQFDTRSVEATIAAARRVNPETNVAIKSTIPVGFTEMMRGRYETSNILFAPEFLRESKSLEDCLHPSRIVVGSRGQAGQEFAELMLEAAEDDNVPVLQTGPREAEAIKLFANSYLALRVAYFNEIDTYAATQDLSAGDIIAGVSMDRRIGDFYNNPSFGYGGYCLPKDTRQLLANYAGIPQDLISAVVKSNETRESFIASDILTHQPRVVGVHRLIMKAGSDNFRSSSIFAVISKLRTADIEVIIYEPATNANIVEGCRVIPDLAEFKRRSDIIVANRLSPELADANEKVYSRDLYARD